MIESRLSVSFGRITGLINFDYSHIGDASQTEYSLTRQLNVGKLVRERFGLENSFIIGFSTHYGTVRAAKEWNGKDFVMELNPSLKDSIGSVLHEVSESNEHKDFGLIFRSNSKTSQLTAAQTEAKQVLSFPLIQRFVGVQYVKRTELQSHYSRCKISKSSVPGLTGSFEFSIGFNAEVLSR